MSLQVAPAAFRIFQLPGNLRFGRLAAETARTSYGPKEDSASGLVVINVIVSTMTMVVIVIVVAIMVIITTIIIPTLVIVFANFFVHICGYY